MDTVSVFRSADDLSDYCCRTWSLEEWHDLPARPAAGNAPSVRVVSAIQLAQALLIGVVAVFSEYFGTCQMPAGLSSASHS